MKQAASHGNHISYAGFGARAAMPTVVRQVWLRCMAVAALLILAVGAPESARAQRHYVPHVHIGAHAGMSMSRQSFFPKVQEKSLNGMMIGVSFRYAEERHVGLVAELNLEQRGWLEDFEEAPLSYQRRLTYIELPLMTHIFFGSRTVKCFINLGPQVGYMIGDKVTSNFDYSKAPDVPGFPNNRRYEQMDMKVSNRFDYGITAGMGVEFIVKRRHCIQLQGRYYYGLGNIFPSSKSDTFSASRGSSIIVTLGYMFRLK